jgi:hypothetical protein
MIRFLFCDNSLQMIHFTRRTLAAGNVAGEVFFPVVANRLARLPESTSTRDWVHVCRSGLHRRSAGTRMHTG